MCKAVTNRQLRKKNEKGKWLYFEEENEVGTILCFLVRCDKKHVHMTLNLLNTALILNHTTTCKSIHCKMKDVERNTIAVFSWI